MAWEQDRSSPPPGFPPLPPLPPGRYTSDEFFALERAHLWSKVWLYAAHRSQLPEPGSYLLLDIPEAPIFLVHGNDGAIRAFYNVCSHRGAPLVRDAAGSERYLRCTYHHWTYDTQGQLVSVMDERDFPEPFDKSCLGLQEVRCEQWGPWLFINEDPGCVPLHEWLGMLVDEFEQFDIERLRPAAVKSYEVECNWKLTMDAFLEVYHIKGIHPKTVGASLDHRGAVMGLLPNGHTRMTCPTTAKSSPILAATCQPGDRIGHPAARNGAVTASAPQMRARPRYSVSSNGPMAFTILSYAIADTNASVLPASSAHHAQASPRRKAVTVMAIAISQNATL